MRRVIFASWADVPHLTEAMKNAQLEGMDPHLRDARTRGIPFLGSGAVYPLTTDVFEIKPFAIPDHWPRAYGFDVGWNRTAAIWGAIDPANDVLYLYDEHYVAEENPNTHANSIMGIGASSKQRAKWIPGVIDPASNGRSQKDGTVLMETYQRLGMDVQNAVNAVDAGIHEVWLRMSSGRLKVFSTLQFFFKEYLLYRRTKDGKIVKNKQRPDHLMDAMRYLVISGIQRMKAVPYQADENAEWGDPHAQSGQSWMAS